MERLSSSRSWSEPYSDMVQNCSQAAGAAASQDEQRRRPPPPAATAAAATQGGPPPAAPGLQACHRRPGCCVRSPGGGAGPFGLQAGHHPLPSARLRGSPPATAPAECDARMQYARAMKGGRRARPGGMSAGRPGTRSPGALRRGCRLVRPIIGAPTARSDFLHGWGSPPARPPPSQRNKARQRAGRGPSRRHDAVDAVASEPTDCRPLWRSLACRRRFAAALLPTWHAPSACPRLQGVLLVMNGLAIVNNERFLEPSEWAAACTTWASITLLQ